MQIRGFGGGITLSTEFHMSQPDRISFVLTDAEKSEVDTSVASLKRILLPHLVSLSTADRKEIAKMGDKSRAFAQKSLEHCKRNPELVPAILDVSAFEIDMNAVETIEAYHQPLLQLVEMLDDSMVLSGGEAMNAARMYYASIKIAAKNRIASASTIFDDLAPRYSRLVSPVPATDVKP